MCLSYALEPSRCTCRTSHVLLEGMSGGTPAFAPPTDTPNLAAHELNNLESDVKHNFLHHKPEDQWSCKRSPDLDSITCREVNDL